MLEKKFCPLIKGDCREDCKFIQEDNVYLNLEPRGDNDIDIHKGECMITSNLTSIRKYLFTMERQLDVIESDVDEIKFNIESKNKN
jgi:hypothetical protein